MTHTPRGRDKSLLIAAIRNARKHDDAGDGLADMVLDCWDSDWDEVPCSHRVGDYSIGSSDFYPRSE